MKRLFPFFALLGAAVCICGGAAKASEIKTPLVRDAVVSGKSIYLSDLLPQSSPSAFRLVAQGILIGSAPQPGSVRVLSSGEIVRLLDQENLTGQVLVPEQIVIHHSGHLITREEVANAIQRTLSRNETFKDVQIASKDIRLAAPVTISAEDADLRVTRIEMDASLHEMKFWLVSGAEPTLLPFIAMTRATCNTCGLGEPGEGGTARESVRPNLGVQVSWKAGAVGSGLDTGRNANPSPAYVDRGTIAQLHLISGPEIQMFLSATSLERGTLGQIVRVKIQNTGKILSARVVGRNQLEAIF